MIYDLSNLPGSIPIFPLTGALVLPRARLPLNIFEPRYLQMIDDALKTEHRLIGMIQTRDVPTDIATRRCIKSAARGGSLRLPKPTMGGI